MAKKTAELDTPFRKGERVIATRQVRGVPSGTRGQVQIHNGLGTWNRYWVMFDGGTQVGQVDHDSLTRPEQFTQWIEREEDRANAELQAANKAAAAAEASTAGASGGGGGGLADQIPADLLERSRAAKKRLLG